MITYIKDGEEITIEREETEEELKERIKFYRQHNYKIKKVVKKCVTVCWIDVNY